MIMRLIISWLLAGIFVGSVFFLAGALFPEKTVWFCDWKISADWKRFIGWLGFLLGMTVLFLAFVCGIQINHF